MTVYQPPQSPGAAIYAMREKNPCDLRIAFCHRRVRIPSGPVPSWRVALYQSV